ncbi:unnamed protein product, partial [Staurois parvus]
VLTAQGTCTLIIRALIISVAPSVPLVSAHNCHLPVPINATYQCPLVHINATYQHPSELPFNAVDQCQSVLPISSSQYHLSVPPISAHQ